MTLPAHQKTNEYPAVWAGLDLLRGAMAIMVLFGHALTSSLHWNYGADHKEYPFLASLFISTSGYRVVGFFIISGFCIHRSIMSMRKIEGGFVWNYTLARVTRLYPMYALALLLALVSMTTLGSFEPMDHDQFSIKAAGHLLMLQGFTGTFHELGPAWTISYEAVYYLAWPLILTVCAWRRKLALVVGILGALLIASVSVVLWRNSGGSAESKLIFLWLVPSQFILWLGGATLAEYWDVVLPKIKRWCLPVAVSGVLMGFLVFGALHFNDARQWMLIVASYLLLPLWLLLFAAFSLWKGYKKWLGFTKVIGLLSYPLYIMHQVFLDAFTRILPAPGFWTGSLLLCALVLLVVFIIGVPFESASLVWRKKFLERYKKQAHQVDQMTSERA